jgi:hypothetical protein
VTEPVAPPPLPPDDEPEPAKSAAAASWSAAPGGAALDPDDDFGGTIDFRRYKGRQSGQLAGSSRASGEMAGSGPAPARHIVVSRRTGRQALVEKAEFSLGRDPNWADFAVADNSNVSSAHAIIRCVGGRYFLLDTNSTNHVTLNGQRIPPNQEIPLRPGSTFVLGDEVFEFR